MPGVDFSATTIANRALFFCGINKRIAALTDATPEARAIREVYDSVLEESLRKWPWKFATQRAILAENATAPLHTREKSFALPVTCLYLLPPDPEADFTQRDWQIEGRNIITNFSDPPEIRFIAREEDPNVMTPDFRKAFACEIARAVAPALTNSTQKVQKLTEDCAMFWAEAQMADAAEGPPRDLQPDEQDIWLESRL